MTDVVKLKFRKKVRRRGATPDRRCQSHSPTAECVYRYMSDGSEVPCRYVNLHHGNGATTYIIEANVDKLDENYIFLATDGSKDVYKEPHKKTRLQPTKILFVKSRGHYTVRFKRIEYSKTTRNIVHMLFKVTKMPKTIYSRCEIAFLTDDESFQEDDGTRITGIRTTHFHSISRLKTKLNLSRPIRSFTDADQTASIQYNDDFSDVAGPSDMQNGDAVGLQPEQGDGTLPIPPPSSNTPRQLSRRKSVDFVDGEHEAGVVHSQMCDISSTLVHDEDNGESNDVHLSTSGLRRSEYQTHQMENDAFSDFSPSTSGDAMYREIDRDESNGFYRNDRAMRHASFHHNDDEFGDFQVGCVYADTHIGNSSDHEDEFEAHGEMRHIHHRLRHDHDGELLRMQDYLVDWLYRTYKDISWWLREFSLSIYDLYDHMCLQLEDLDVRTAGFIFAPMCFAILMVYFILFRQSPQPTCPKKSRLFIDVIYQRLPCISGPPSVHNHGRSSGNDENFGKAGIFMALAGTVADVCYVTYKFLYVDGFPVPTL